MKKLTLLPLSSLISAIILLLLSTATPSSVQAQEKSGGGHGPYVVFGYELGKSDLTPTVRKQLDAIAPGLKQECEAGKIIEASGFSDYHRFQGVSKERSDRLNDILAWDRLRTAIRYLVDEKGLLESCFDDNDPVYADSKKRGVRFEINSKLESRLAIISGQIADDVIDRIGDRLTALQKKNDQQDERLDEQDERIAENKATNEQQDEQLSDHEKRIKELENQNLDVSGYLGIGIEKYAAELAFTGTAGIQIGQIEFAGWYGFKPNIGTADLDIGTVNLRRETYGGTATWYALRLNDDKLEIGPSLGFEHGEDAIEDRKEYLRGYDSLLLGASFDAAIAGPMHLKLDLAYAPVIKSYFYDNKEFTYGSPTPVRAMVTVGVNF